MAITSYPPGLEALRRARHVLDEKFDNKERPRPRGIRTSAKRAAAQDALYQTSSGEPPRWTSRPPGVRSVAIQQLQRQHLPAARWQRPLAADFHGANAAPQC